MSNRHYLNLKNKITGEESSVQLFGNNEWYDTFFKYLKKLNPEIAYFEDSFEDIVVLNIKDLIKAIDESIWNEVIASEIHKNKNEWENFKQKFKIKGTPTFAIYENKKLVAKLDFEENNGFTPYELEKWITSNLSDE